MGFFGTLNPTVATVFHTKIVFTRKPERNCFHGEAFTANGFKLRKNPSPLASLQQSPLEFVAVIWKQKLIRKYFSCPSGAKKSALSAIKNLVLGHTNVVAVVVNGHADASQYGLTKESSTAENAVFLCHLFRPGLFFD